eukprot:scaffold21700_cov89-Isochrysis_galbana.AAC.1
MSFDRAREGVERARRGRKCEGEREPGGRRAGKREQAAYISACCGYSQQMNCGHSQKGPPGSAAAARDSACTGVAEGGRAATILVSVPGTVAEASEPRLRLEFCSVGSGKARARADRWRCDRTEQCTCALRSPEATTKHPMNGCTDPGVLSTSERIALPYREFNLVARKRDCERVQDFSSPPDPQPSPPRIRQPF